MQNCFHRLNNEEKRWRNLYFQRLIVSFLLSIPTSMSVAISQSILVLVGKTFEYLIFQFFVFAKIEKFQVAIILSQKFHQLLKKSMFEILN